MWGQGGGGCRDRPTWLRRQHNEHWEGDQKEARLGARAPLISITTKTGAQSFQRRLLKIIADSPFLYSWRGDQNKCEQVKRDGSYQGGQRHGLLTQMVLGSNPNALTI